MRLGVLLRLVGPPGQSKKPSLGGFQMGVRRVKKTEKAPRAMSFMEY